MALRRVLSYLRDDRERKYSVEELRALPLVEASSHEVYKALDSGFDDKTGQDLMLAIRRAGFTLPRFKFLDVGTGKGDYVNYCRQRGIEAQGIDIVDVFQYNKDWFEQGDATHMRFSDESFDVVHEFQAIAQMLELENDREAAEKTLREMARVLKKDGVLLRRSLCEHPNEFAPEFFRDLGLRYVQTNEYWSSPETKNEQPTYVKL